MEENILRKEYFGRRYTFMQVHIEQTLNFSFIKKNGIDGIILLTNSPKDVI